MIYTAVIRTRIVSVFTLVHPGTCWSCDVSTTDTQSRCRRCPLTGLESLADSRKAVFFMAHTHWKLTKQTIVCTCVYACVCMYVCVVNVYIYLYVCMYVSMYDYIYVCMYACMYVCMYVCMYECVYVCMYV